jgi:hypothetical protein
MPNDDEQPGADILGEVRSQAGRGAQLGAAGSRLPNFIDRVDELGASLNDIALRMGEQFEGLNESLIALSSCLGLRHRELDKRRRRRSEWSGPVSQDHCAHDGRTRPSDGGAVAGRLLGDGLEEQSRAGPSEDEGKD